MADLIDTATLKSYIGQAGSGADDQLDTIVSAVSEAMQRYMGRRIPQATYTDEKHSGDGVHDYIVPREAPVNSITSIVLDGTALAAGDYDLEDAPGRWPAIYYTPGGATTPSPWPKGRRNIVLTYSGGYSTVPPDIEQAALEQGAYVFSQRNRVGQRTKSAGGDLTESYMITDFLPGVLTVMELYRVSHAG